MQPYDEQHIGKECDFPAVYILCKRTYHGENLPFYIGHADALRAELKRCCSEVLKGDELGDLIRGSDCFYTYGVVMDGKEREGIQRFLVEHFNPECNMEDVVYSESIEVNLP